MPKLALTYFDFDGGRGEAARLAMHLGGIAFEDRRIAGKDWPALRDKTPFQAMPVLEVDGKVITQSNTINRYLGKLAGLYPKDDWQAALVDEVMDAVEDISTKIGNTICTRRRGQEEGARGAGGRSHPALPAADRRPAQGGRRRVVRRKAPDRRRPQVLPVGAMAQVRSARPYPVRHRGQERAAPREAPGAGQEPSEDRGVLRGAQEVTGKGTAADEVTRSPTLRAGREGELRLHRRPVGEAIDGRCRIRRFCNGSARSRSANQRKADGRDKVTAIQRHGAFSRGNCWRWVQILRQDRGGDPGR